MSRIRDRDERPMFGASGDAAGVEDVRFFEPGSIVSEEWRKAERRRTVAVRLRRRDRLALAKLIFRAYLALAVLVSWFGMLITWEFARSSRVIGLDAFEYSTDWSKLGRFAAVVPLFFLPLFLIRWWGRRRLGR